MIFVLSVLLLPGGLLAALSPETIYFLTELWKHDGDSEPSDLYLQQARVGGILVSAVGVFCLIASFFI